MEHATLVWAQTYENANRRLAAWGTVFGAFPGLYIVHRAGKVHSNVDPLSRLQRILLHQSPAVNETYPISGIISEQPIRAWESISKEPALKASFIVVTWEDLLEASLEDPAAWAITRRQAREPRMEREEAEEGDLAEKKEDLGKEEKMGQKSEGKRRKARCTVELRPGQVVLSIAEVAVQ